MLTVNELCALPVREAASSADRWLLPGQKRKRA